VKIVGDRELDEGGSSEAKYWAVLVKTVWGDKGWKLCIGGRVGEVRQFSKWKVGLVVMRQCGYQCQNVWVAGVGECMWWLVNVRMLCVECLK